MVPPILLSDARTDRRGPQERLRTTQELARVGEVAAALAHQFRNGLATIHGYALLLNLDELSPTDRLYVEGIREETRALGELVVSFLQFARPGAPHLAPVDLEGVAAWVADDLRGQVEASGGDITLRGVFGVVAADEGLLREAVGNLARNALESCLDASVTPEIVIQGAVDPQAGEACLSVDDNGPGLPPEARVHLFSPFHTTKPHGTGLGLALVRKVVTAHAGRVGAGVSSRGGASFQIVLPLANHPT